MAQLRDDFYQALNMLLLTSLFLEVLEVLPTSPPTTSAFASLFRMLADDR
jgi:hypothetical protein